MMLIWMEEKKHHGNETKRFAVLTKKSGHGPKLNHHFSKQGEKSRDEKNIQNIFGMSLVWLCMGYEAHLFNGQLVTGENMFTCLVSPSSFQCYKSSPRCILLAFGLRCCISTTLQLEGRALVLRWLFQSQRVNKRQFLRGFSSTKVCFGLVKTP